MSSGNCMPMPVRVLPENFWREVWHDGCPQRGPMKRHRNDTLALGDGSVLVRYECLGCGANCYAGLDSRRYVVARPWPATEDQPAPERAPADRLSSG